MGGRAPTPMPCTCPQLTNKIVFVVSFVGNRGTFIRGYKAMVMDMEFLYHVGYILTSVLGLFAHELFYSILVRPWWGWGWAGRRGGWGFLPVAGSSPAPGLLLLGWEERICSVLVCWTQPGLQNPDGSSWSHLPCTVEVQAGARLSGFASQCGPS